MSLQRRKREVLRNVVNLPGVREHVRSNWDVGGALRSRTLPLVSAGISQVQSEISTYDIVFAPSPLFLT
jgi:hypothetical protein